MKCQYLDEKTGGRGVIFATGTPISNSMTELYTMMRYLQSDTLGDLVDLLIEKPFLTLPADGDTLKLTVSHDDGVVVTGRNTGAELLAVMGLKVLFGCD